MKIEDSGIEGVKVIEPRVFGDSRGFFMETYNKKSWLDSGLPNVDFVQDSHSQSSKGVLRGLHFQSPSEQGKLVRVVAGAVFDVVVDIRKESKTFGRWFGIKLSSENKKNVWIPAGLAHGFLTLEDNTEFVYKCTDYYTPEDEKCLLWNDSSINVAWPDLGEPYILSDKDKKGLQLTEL
jgi:dTDP-4-dehydrorhamnose 3,5-epimerase